MGFRFHWRNGEAAPLTVEEQIADALSEVKNSLDAKGIDDPRVWSGYPDGWRPGDEDDEDEHRVPVGLFLNLERCTRSNPTWQLAFGIERAFALGKIAAGKALTAEEEARLRALDALEDAFSRGGQKGGGQTQRMTAEAWQRGATKTYEGLRAVFPKASASDIAGRIILKLGSAVPSKRRVQEWVGKMDASRGYNQDRRQQRAG